MNKIFFRSGLVVAVVALVAGVALHQNAQAASNVYSFVARGIITDFDEGGKTIKVDVTKVDGKGKSDLEGNNTEFVIGSAKVFKVASGKDTRATYHKLAIGQEIGFKGVKKNDDTYNLSFIRIHQRSFAVIGLLESHDASAKTLKILVTSSTYKPGTYKKGTEITMSYKDDSTFYEKTTANPVAFSEVNADAQRVKVTGSITSASTWEVAKLWDHYKGK